MSLEQTYAEPQQVEEFTGKPEDIVKDVEDWLKENNFKITGITAPKVKVPTDPALVVFHTGIELPENAESKKAAKELVKTVKVVLGLSEPEAPKEAKPEVNGTVEAKSDAPKTAKENKPEAPKNSGVQGTNSLAG